MAQKNKVHAKVRSAKTVASATKKAVRTAAAKPARNARPAIKAAAAVKKPVAAVASQAKKASPAKAPTIKAPMKAHDVKKPVAAAAPVKKSAAQPVAGEAHAAAAAQLARGVQRPITVAPATAVRVAAALNKSAGQKLTAPIQPATPKAIAEKTAAARIAMAAQKKPVSQRHGFKTNEFIVYPAHGVGRIIGIEEQEIAGMSLELFVINFDKEKLTLRVPTGKLESVGMRKLADEAVVKKAMETLKGRARVKRTMWSRRAQEYVAKINSGDLVSIAEVVRDLYRSEAQPEQSYSERQLYEDALDRMAREIAAVEKLDERGAVQRITEVLSKSARGRRIAEGTEAESTKAA
jgi:CarD family transcriptional regulator